MSSILWGRRILVKLRFDTISHCNLVVFGDSGERKMDMGVRLRIHLSDVHVQTTALGVEALEIAYTRELGRSGIVVCDVGSAVRDATIRVRLSGTLYSSQYKSHMQFGHASYVRYVRCRHQSGCRTRR